MSDQRQTSEAEIHPTVPKPMRENLAPAFSRVRTCPTLLTEGRCLRSNRCRTLPLQRTYHTAGFPDRKAIRQLATDSSVPGAARWFPAEIRWPPAAVGGRLFYMSNQLFRIDDPSRQTAYRFVFKIVISLIISMILAKGSFVLILSGWIGLYSLFATVYATVRREHFFSPSFNHWDESLWLLTLALALREFHKLAT
jgi:hypothetical protein